MTRSTTKQALLEQWKKGRAVSAASALAIQRRDTARELRLSFPQERLWFLDRLDQGRTAYNICATFRLGGRLDVGRLSQALREIVRRHEVLRTTFREVDGTPLQSIAVEATLPVSLVDMQNLPLMEQAARLEQIRHAEVRQRFDLTTGPLLRTVLVRRAVDEHMLLLTRHHVVADAWSLALFVDELFVQYDAVCGKSAAPLDDLPIQYADYALWQRDHVDTALATQIDYWLRQLHDAPRVLDLGLDRQRSGAQGSPGALVRFALPATLVDRFTSLARDENVTEFMLLLAAFQVLLARYAASDDVVVGCPIANRNRPEVERLIGVFANTVVMRGDLSGDPSFRVMLRRTRDVCLAAYAHQDVPFERLVELLLPHRDTDRSPLFQAMFVLHNETRHLRASQELSIELVEIDSAAAMFDLTLAVTESRGRWHGAIEYNTDLFRAETMTRLARHYVRVLEAAVGEPDRPMSAWAWLEPEERQALLAAAAGAPLAPPTQSVPELFDAQVARTPEAIAVTAAGQSLSYAGLQQAANAVARVLRARGVGPEVRVAVCLERSVDLVVALLGVLKAGGAYVPIDPAMPAERLAWLVADTGAPVLVSAAALRGHVAAAGVPVVELPLAAPLANDSDADAQPAPRIAPEHLAYVIYTSGSTGTPKGVLVTHGNLVQSTQARAAFYPNSIDAFLLVSSISFDSSVAGLFWTLCSGGTLVLPSDAASTDPVALGELVTLHRISHVLAIPLLYRSILDETTASSLDSLRTVVVAGEVCPVALVERHYSIIPHAELVNEYGPTETTVWSTAYRCGQGETMTVPLGRPISGTRTYIVDKHLNLVPPGVTGELCIGGAGVARGYLHRPDLTAERFVCDPVAAAPGDRMYRTGDLVRHRADGELEFVGRRDRQVKLRGVRIELTGLEQAISHHPHAAAVAVTLLGPADRQHLSAFVVPRQATSVTAADFEAFARRHLPRSMVPATFTIVDKLPRLSNGKIDHSALQDLEAHRDGREFHAPRTQTQMLVAQIWCELLKLDRVDVTASFFELGGHSLLASRVLARVGNVFNVSLPLRSFFNEPTVAGLEAAIEAARSTQPQSTPPPIAPHGSDATRFPLSFAQERLWILDRINPGACTYNVPTASRLSGPIDRVALANALRVVVQRHDILRTTFDAPDGRPQQCVHPTMDIHLGERDLSDTTGSARQEALSIEMASEATAAFDLSRAPLLRATLVRLDRDDHVLLITTHHIISDAWSLNVLFAELGAAYAAATGRPAPLESLPVQYADYALWQRSWLDSGAGDAHLEYWKRNLGHEMPITELKTDRPRPPIPTMRGAVHAFELPQRLCVTLSRISVDERVTPFMVFVATFAALLQRYTGLDDVVIGSPVAGRRRPELEGLIGCFVNMLVLRVDCSGGLTFRELLGRVRQICLDADAYQDIPFERVVDALRPVRDLSRQPLFQIALAVQNAPDDVVFVQGVSLSRLDIHTATAKFDLMLTLTERDGRWHGAIEYNTDLFRAETMTRLARHYVRVLEAAVGEPDRPMSAWAWLEPEERQALLAAAAGAPLAPPTQSVPELFDAQVARTPEAIAVTAAGQSLSYAGLQQAANAVARVLRARGVGPEVRVAVCLERSVDLVVALLGVLKAGGAYVPIDPATPPERLRWMLADTAAPVMVTQPGIGPPVAGAEVEIIELPIATAAPAPESAAHVAQVAQVAPDNLAYVIYTSGSTGTPKGVLVTHANVVRLLSSTQDRFQFDERDVWTLFHSSAFDFSVWELWGALLTGGRAVVVPTDVQRSPDAFYQLLLSEHVTVLNQTPSAFRHVARVATAAPVSDRLSLRLIVFGGEALDVSHLAAWFERFGDIRPELVNMYGITETTVHVTCRAVTRGDLERPWVSPIGQPLADLWTFILDRDMQPVPRDVPGELYVGGQGVARGYLDRPDLTAERFVPDPYSAVPGARLYRTGDRARRLSDGDIEYLGRTDHQIKVRGFRIETGEIEAALSMHSMVRECVVVGRPDEHGDTQIVAYLAPASGGTLHADRLRRWVSERLPEYMVPAAFIILETLPRTSGGKVDRKALPLPRGVRPDLENDYVAAKDGLESRLATLWAGVLELDKVGVHDNFFSLGGNSLRLAQLHGLLQEVLALNVPMVELFKFPTVRSFAEHLQATSQGPTSVQQGHARARARRESRGPQRVVNRTHRRPGQRDFERLPD